MQETVLQTPVMTDTADIVSRTTRSGAIMFIVKVLRHGFAFLVQFMLLNLLNPSDFGLMRYVTIVLSVISLVNELGLSVAIVQKKVLTKDEAASAFTLSIVAGILFYSIIFISAPLLSAVFNAPLLTDLIRVGGLTVFFGSFSVVQKSLLQRDMRFGTLGLIELVTALAGSGAALILAFLGHGVWSLVVSLLVYNVLSSICFLIASPLPKGRFFNLNTARPLWVFGLLMIGQRCIDFATANLDFLVVGRVFGEYLLGIYGFSFDLVKMPQIAFSVILTPVILSTFSRIQENPQQIRRGFLLMTELVVAVSIPFLVSVFCLTDELLYVVGIFRKNNVWISAKGPLKVLALVGLIYTFSSLPGAVWISVGKLKTRVIWSAAMGLSVAIALLLGSQYGLMGVCWAMLIRAVVSFPPLLYVNKSILGVKPMEYILALLPSVISGTLLCFTEIAIINAFPGSSAQRNVFVLAGSIVCGLLIYFLVYSIIWKDKVRNLKDLFLQVLKRK